MLTPESIVDNLLRAAGASIYVIVLLGFLAFVVYESYILLKERTTPMEYQVYQVDAWAEPCGGWTYNETFPICKVSIKGDPTTRKILKALRNIELLPPPNKLRVKVDDYFDYEGIWAVQKRSDSCPLFELIELT